MRDFATLPNLLSLSRVGLGAAAAVWIAGFSQSFLFGAAVLIALGELTDFLDGHFARRCGSETALGKSLDAACDAIFHLSVFLALLVAGWMPLWAAVVIYAAEIALPYLRSFSKQLKAKAPPPGLEGLRAGAHGSAQIAAVLVVYFAGSHAAVAGLLLLPLVFAADVAATLAVLAANLRPLVAAQRAAHEL